MWMRKKVTAEQLRAETDALDRMVRRITRRPIFWSRD